MKKNKGLVQPIDWLKIISMHDIIERSVSITYPQIMIKYWSLDDQYIIEIIDPEKGWTLVRTFNNIINNCKKKKRLVWLNDILKT